MVTVEVNDAPLASDSWSSIAMEPSRTTEIVVALSDGESGLLSLYEFVVVRESDLGLLGFDSGTGIKTEVVIALTVGSVGLVAMFVAFLLCKRTKRLYRQVFFLNSDSKKYKK